jgi:hypothetical protein
MQRFRHSKPAQLAGVHARQSVCDREDDLISPSWNIINVRHWVCAAVRPLIGIEAVNQGGADEDLADMRGAIAAPKVRCAQTSKGRTFGQSRVHVLTSDETDGVAIAVQQAPVHLKK